MPYRMPASGLLRLLVSNGVGDRLITIRGETIPCTSYRLDEFIEPVPSVTPEITEDTLSKEQAIIESLILFSQEPPFRGSSKGAERQYEQVSVTQRALEARDHPLHMAKK